MTAQHIAITLILLLILAVCGYELGRVRKVRTREIDRLAARDRRQR